jgi:hypothetical protein
MYQSQNNIFSLSYADISIKKFVDERIIMLIKLFSINVKAHIFKRLDQKLYRLFSKLRRSFQHVILYVVLNSFSQNHLGKMCTAMKIQ